MTKPLPTETHSHTTAAGFTQKLDVFRPTGESRRCAVLVFHGGGWRTGTPQDVHDRAGALAERGFTAIAADYRLLDAAPWPAPVDDLRTALGWVRAHAHELDIEPENIVVQGHSAGGHLALMSGTLDRSERPAAIVAYYPPVGFHPVAPPASSQLRPEDLVLDEEGRMPSWMVFPAGGESAQDLDAASPIARLDGGFPPTVLLHGTQDMALHHRSSLLLHSRLSALGVPSSLHVYAGRIHEFDRAPTMLAHTSRDVALFLECYVTDRKRVEAEAELYPFPPR
ncbi:MULTISPECIES: alpha/beta hydrolase [unclassified Streptomyces]|uniref:alpha/beta hydrolase n=1 Tax=unclassified Streptomyces TaxID=2593676 RepID=UPI0036E412C2